VNVQPMIDRLALACKILLPNRSLKFFPPDFTFRRPIVSLLAKRLHSGKRCYLTLFRLELAYRRQHTVPEEAWREIVETARRLLRRLVAERVADTRLIAIDRYSDADFALLTENSDETETGHLVPAALADVALEIRDELERELSGLYPDWKSALGLATVSVPLVAAKGKSPMPAERVLQESYHTALAIATGTLTPRMLHLRDQLELVLERGTFSVLAQPIMNLTTGDVSGWEILTRGPEGTALHAPDELFKFASQIRMLSRLEFLVVGRALEEIASRSIREPVFLNVTAVTLSHPLFLSHVLECLERHPSLSARQIFFEITERHQIEDFDAMIEILRTFRKHGFRFAVDDAGSGYSSLQWIGELVPELIKIDRSVIRHVDRIAIKESLLRAIVNAAREINCEIIAEGVEREEEADVLFRLAVDMGQGYYFARPNVLLHEHERDVFQETKSRIQSRRGLVAS